MRWNTTCENIFQVKHTKTCAGRRSFFYLGTNFTKVESVASFPKLDLLPVYNHLHARPSSSGLQVQSLPQGKFETYDKNQYIHPFPR